MWFGPETEIVSIGFRFTVADHIEVFGNRPYSHQLKVWGKIPVCFIPKSIEISQGHTFQYELAYKV